jgi:hypothetical protein
MIDDLSIDWSIGTLGQRAIIGASIHWGLIDPLNE